jgi:PAS domain S-box-containing protein
MNYQINEALYKSILDSSNDLVFLKDPDFRYLMVNKANADFFGKTQEEIIGKTDFDLLPETNAQSCRITDEEAIHKNQTIINVEKIESDYWETHKFPVLLPDGNVGVGGIIRNITKIKKVDDMIKKSENVLQKIFDILPIGLWIADKNGRLIRGNPMGIKIWGAEPKVGPDQYGVFIARRLPSREEIKPGDWSLNHTVNKGLTITNELLEIDAFDGQKRIILNFTAPILNEDNQVDGAIILNQDITDLVKVSEENQALNMQLEDRVKQRTKELERMNQELESFAYTISHDLRAPLRAIDGFSGLLQERIKDKLDPESTRYLHIVRENTKKMDQLIRDLLFFSRTSRTELKYTDLDMMAIVNQVYQELKDPEDPKKIILTVHTLPPVKGDPSLIRQVWINLIDNAIKYSRNREIPRIEIGSYPEENRQIFYIRDNGVGFNPEYYNKLFVVFQRLHNPDLFEGTGVGLAIVQRILQRHHGEIWAESKENEGAKFFFSLPV